MFMSSLLGAVEVLHELALLERAWKTTSSAPAFPCDFYPLIPFPHSRAAWRLLSVGPVCPIALWGAFSILASRPCGRRGKIEGTLVSEALIPHSGPGGVFDGDSI